MLMGSRVRKLLAALTLAAVGIGAPASVAHAETGYVGGGSGISMSYSNTPGTAFVNVSCYTSTNSVVINLTANVRAGYVNGQWVSYRYNVTNRATGWSTTSGFAPVALIGGGASYPYSTLAGSVYRPGIRADWVVQVQFVYWQGSAWSYGSWLSPSGGYGPGTVASNGLSYNSNHCYT